MQNIPFLLLTGIALSLLLTACEKQTNNDDPFLQPGPDLCAETDNCDDGILDALLKIWTPVGGNFLGQDLTHGCVDTFCPDIEFTFLADSTYLLKMTTVHQDSNGAWTEETVETGLYRVGDCICYQHGNSWDGYQLQKVGKIHCSPAGGDAYWIDFRHFQGGVFFDSSSRDSTLILFLD